MDSLSLADVFWSALVLAGITAQALDARARRRAGRERAETATARGDVPERELTLA